MLKPKSILIFAYYSFNDPIFQSAVLPYFRNFGDNYKFVILTFEQKKYRITKKNFKLYKQELQNDNIFLYRARWHSDHFKLIKKAFDFILGVLISQSLIWKHRSRVIYSEGFPGAIVGYYLSKFNKIPHVIHTFEPHAAYMLEAGVWTEKSWEYILLKKVEIKIANAAKKIFTATTAYREVLLNLGVKSQIVRIPSCVDTNYFTFSESERRAKRRLLNFDEEDIVICYLGKLGGMYMDVELFYFFKLCLQHSEKFKLLIISTEDPKKIFKISQQQKINPEKFKVIQLTRDQIPGFLSACDWGFVAVKPLPSKRFCSPIKTGEYWACGLPVIIPVGISDDYILTKENNLGISFDNINEDLVCQIYNKSYTEYDRKIIRNFCIHERDISKFKTLLKTTFIECYN